MINIEDKKSFFENGYLIIRSIFTQDEVMRIKQIALSYFADESNHYVYHNCGKVLPNFFEYIPELRTVMNQKIIDISKELIGDVKYLYHSDLHYNMFNNWHRDLSNNYIDNFESEEIFKKAQIYKVGIYLQDHQENNQGLSLIPKSHTIFDENKFGDSIDIHSNIGDIIIFDQRIMHKGYSIVKENIPICKDIEKDSLTVDKDKFEYFEKSRQLNNSTKLSIFFGIGVDNKINKEFSKGIIKRQNQQNNIDKYKISKGLEKYLLNIKLKPIDIKES